MSFLVLFFCSSSDDATKALNAVKTIEGRKVFVSYASSKSIEQSKKSPEKKNQTGENII